MAVVAEDAVVLLLAAVAEVADVVCGTGVKVPAVTRLFGEVEDTPAPLARFCASAINA
jgi:hypothetical protein